MAATWGPLEMSPLANKAPTSAQLGPTWLPVWLQLGLTLDPTCATCAQVGTLSDKSEPKMGPTRTQCDTLKILIFTATSNVFWLWWGFVGGRFAQACLGPNCHVGPQQLGSSWPELGASSAQVGSCSAQLRPRTAKFDPSRLVACFFPLCPIRYGGQYSSRSDLNYTGWLRMGFPVHGR